MSWALRLLLAGVVLAAATGAARAQGEGPLIRLRFATFDPLRNSPLPDPVLRMPRVGDDEVSAYLLQFQGPVQPAWKSTLQAREGIVFEDYVPDYAFVVRMTLRQAAALPLRYPFVRWTGAFHPAYKMDPGLFSAGQSFPIVARTHGEQEAAALTRRLQQFGAGVLGASKDDIAVAGSLQMAIQLARTPEVKWVQLRRAFKFRNDRSTGIIGIGGTSGVRLKGFYGAGQTIAIADSGLDTGDASTLNDDFKGRLTKAVALGRKSTNDWSDPNGHGTHVTGSVLGNGTNSGGDPARHSYDSAFAGSAPEANVFFQSIMDRFGGLNGIPNNLYDLFTEPYEAGARVHSNSWGASYNYYLSEDSELDQFVVDHPEMVILFAAGNDGVDLDKNGVIDQYSVGTPAVAKNCITIGASEGLRPPTENWGGLSRRTYGVLDPTSWSTDPIKSDYLSDNAEGMAAFSSRGPAIDGRIKPDLVAPGSSIISVWSRAASRDSAEGSFTGPYTDANPRSKYVYMSGTSMATPLAAGAAALVREYYQKVAKLDTPTAALVKATMINGAHEMAPGQYDTDATQEIRARPNNSEGFGRIDLSRALYPAAPRRAFWMDRPRGLSTGEYHRLVYHVNDSDEPLSITVVWTDQPGAPFAYRALVNNLDLKVIAPDGTTHYGNNMQSGDTANNVENVDIINPQPGNYTLRIEGTNIPEGPQTYALVVSCNGAPLGGRFPDIVPPQVKIINPTARASVKGVVRVDVAASDDRGVDKVVLWVDGVRIGARYAAPYTFYWQSAGWKAGTHTLTATGSDFGNNSVTDAISVTLDWSR